MNSHVAILDIGKTNKKLLVFDDDYQLVHEVSDQLPETTDEDEYPCEDLNLLNQWCKNQINKVINASGFDIKAIQFSGYGASFVLMDKFTQKSSLPLYNYLKPLEREITDSFYATHGHISALSLQTCSPSLGMLNSGLQLIRLKYKQPAMYEGIGLALHLPQYLSFIFTNEPVSELTSIGCHTMLWDFEGHDYHSWVYREQLNLLFPPIHSASSVFQVAFGQKKINVGTGLHDSSAALIPYLTTISEPFILLSTGTWCIAMNPFMQEPLTSEELDQDTLCYITYKGQYVKASRLFLGHEHQEQVDRLCTHFGSGQKKIGSIEYNPGYLSALIQLPETSYIGSNGLMVSGFDSRNLRDYKDFESAYHVLIHDLVSLQVKSISIVQDKNIRSIYVDGGFSRNYIFMKMLALALPELKVFMADASQASALGSAMSIHEHWNMNDVPPLLLNVKQVKV